LIRHLPGHPRSHAKAFGEPGDIFSVIFKEIRIEAVGLGKF
jgi:hypothetical protein